MFIATDLQIRIANDRLEELRRQAAQRRRVRLARRGARPSVAPTARRDIALDDRSRQRIADRFDDVRAGVGLTPTPNSRPCAVVSLDTSRSAEGRAA